MKPTVENGIFVGYDETSKAFHIYLPSQRKVVVRRDVKFEEERAFRKSRELEQGEQQVPPPQVVSQVSSVLQIGSQVFGVTGPHSMGTGSPVSVVQPAGSSGIGFRSQVTGSQYRASGSQSSPVVGTPASGSQVTGVSTSGSSSDEDRPVWEQPSGKKKPKWLRETLKEAREFGKPREPVRAIQIPTD